MGTAHENEDVDEDGESVNELYVNWERQLTRLRRTGDEVRSLHATLTPWYGVGPRRAAEWRWIVESFTRVASTAKKSDFESLILWTTQLHHKGVEILNPDRGPLPIPSPFVRRMPEDQATVEAKRLQRQARHVVAYQEHIRQCLEHFVAVWTALIDGCSICDWDIINDEFPKIELLTDEAKCAFDIWASIDR